MEATDYPHLLPYLSVSVGNIPGYPAMSGGVLYEPAQHPSTLHNQELMTDWAPGTGGMSGALRRGKQHLMNDARTAPSPTYSHLSPSDSASLASPYTAPQALMFAGPSSGYQHMPYSAMPASHLHGLPLHSSLYNQQPAGQQYYASASGEYVLYQAPGPASDRGKPSPTPFDQIRSHHQQHVSFDGQHSIAPLLTTTTLARSYDSTIPQYYSVSSDRWSQVTPEKSRSEVTGEKRKREKAAKGVSQASATKDLKTPKRPKTKGPDGSGRATKRVKVDPGQAPPVLQLPTPPSTGRDPVSSHARIYSDGQWIAPPQETMDFETTQIAISDAVRLGVIVTRHEQEGRKLQVVGLGGTEDPIKIDESKRSPRLKSVPVISTGASGFAFLSTDDVLESEVAWLENGGRSHSPPSSPDAINLRTPTIAHEVFELDDTDSPGTKAEKVSKRLQAFEEGEDFEERMVCTRINMFGRVAVRKDAAARFLGLNNDAILIEEARNDEEAAWAERSIVGPSKTLLKPIWPDEHPPWALAGGNRKERRRKEQEERAHLLQRYLESASDDSSDEEALPSAYHGKGKGKSITRLVDVYDDRDVADARQRRPYMPSANAKDAFMLSIRNRAIPIVPLGKVACACGSASPWGMGPMIPCASCKTWHHLICNGFTDETQLPGQWWCSACEAHAIAMSTPAHSTSSNYHQSNERSSAFKGEYTSIALAPSPMFPGRFSFSQAAMNARTPLTRGPTSPVSRPHRSRILSYGTDMWAYTEDGAPSAMPSTPAPSRADRFSTPRLDDAPFDVTSTPSRHLDLNFGQPSLFSLTPLGGRSRVASGMLIDGTPMRMRNASGVGSDIPTRHDFFRELNKPSGDGMNGSPQTRWPHALMGVNNLSPSPFTHRRSASGNMMSSMRSSSRSGLAFALPMDKEGDQ